MQKEFVSYERALALKELGFEEPCFGAYADNELFILGKPFASIQSNSFNQCLAPLKQQVFRWFRERHQLHFPIMVRNGIWYFERFSITGFKTYEEAEDACIDKLIELVKKK